MIICVSPSGSSHDALVGAGGCFVGWTNGRLGRLVPLPPSGE